MSKKIVLYVDGGAESPRGIAGWGIHGYTYLDDVPKQGIGRTEICTADGYVDPVQHAATGLAVPPKVTPVEYIDGIGPLAPSYTNNEAELHAAINALEYCVTHGIADILLLLDSEYVRRGITEWIGNWQARGWINAQGLPTPNKDLWIRLLNLKTALETAGATIRWVHVSAHSGDLGNTLADWHCWRGKWSAWNNVLDISLRVTPAKGYWNPTVNTNRMLSHRCWYFNAATTVDLKSPDGRYIYHLGSHGPDNTLWGKPDSETSYGVVYLKDKIPVLEQIRAKQRHFIRQNMDALFVANLNLITQSGLYREIETYGDRFLYPRKLRIDLYSPTNVQLTEEANPPFLAYDAVAALTVLEGLLNEHIAQNVTDHLVYTDITDLLYDRLETKKKVTWKLKSTINNSSLRVTAGYNIGNGEDTASLNLTMGTDIADRNTLSALAGLHPKVTVITWRESGVAYRFGTIIETADDVGIWCGYYQNVRIVAPKLNLE